MERGTILYDQNERLGAAARERWQSTGFGPGCVGTRKNLAVVGVGGQSRRRNVGERESEREKEKSL